jgi:hypothetical protein
MIDSIVSEMKSVILQMQNAIKDDIEDIKIANHEKLLDRNDLKLEYMNKIVHLKQNLNEQLVKEMKNGVDVNVYRQTVDSLEDDLKQLYELNGKLASIVLPIKQMYKEMVDDLTEHNGGGSLIDIKA